MEYQKTDIQNSMWNKLILCAKECRLPWRISRPLRLMEKKLLNLFRLIEKKLVRPYDSIVVETSCMCNVRCTWCAMFNSERMDMGVMSLENFKKFIDLNAEYLKRNRIGVFPHGNGEALLNEHFFEMVDYTKEKGVTLRNLHTNLSLEFDIKRLMESSIPGIVVNVGGVTRDVHEKVMKGSNFELVKDNLKDMFRLNTYNKPIYLKMNVIKDNVHQIKELPDFFKALGGNPENAWTWKTEFITPAEYSPEERKEFLRNVVSEEVNDHLTFTYDKEGNITSKIQDCVHIIPCVRWNGQVNICCQDKFSRLNLGNAFETPLKNILNSRKYKTAVKKGRRREFYFCKNCN